MALNIHNVSKNFGGLAALEDVTIEVPAGALYGLIGPNGAGKTTIFNLIMGVYPATSGTITIFGNSIAPQGKKLHVYQIANLGISRTFQNIRLFKQLSVLDNIKTACHAKSSYGPCGSFCFSSSYRRDEVIIDSHAYQLLELFRLQNYAEHLAGSLPYGAQRRLEIARALATGAKILLLDEPAAGMNPREKEELAVWVQEIRKQFGLTILLIEHDMHFVMDLCEKIYVLDHGELIAEGAPASVQCNQKVIEAYLGTD